MNSRKKLTIGILGGMGPKATADLFSKIITLTPATKDQEHIPIIIANNPLIPDRTAYILQNEESPFPQLLTSAKTLERAGADFIVMPCNTAHYFINDLRAHTNIPLMSMIETSAEFIAQQKITRIGLLATTGTVMSKVYHDVLERQGCQVITPTSNQQEILMNAIYSVKGSLTNNLVTPAALQEIIYDMTSQGVHTIILGCTELPLIFDTTNPLFIDATALLAQKAVNTAIITPIIHEEKICE